RRGGDAHPSFVHGEKQRQTISTVQAAKRGGLLELLCQRPGDQGRARQRLVDGAAGARSESGPGVCGGYCLCREKRLARIVAAAKLQAGGPANRRAKYLRGVATLRAGVVPA